MPLRAAVACSARVWYSRLWAHSSPLGSHSARPASMTIGLRSFQWPPLLTQTVRRSRPPVALLAFWADRRTLFFERLIARSPSEVASRPQDSPPGFLGSLL